MAVTPINIARVSQNMKAFNLLSTIRSSQVGLFRVQNQLATGLKFLTPSQDPTGAAKTLALEAAMERLDQLQVALQRKRWVLPFTVEGRHENTEAYTLWSHRSLPLVGACRTAPQIQTLT